jgi:FMN-dependent NADH-azoreductase
VNSDNVKSSTETHQPAVLHIDSSARRVDSLTRILGRYLVEHLGQPVISRDLAAQPLPAIAAEDLIGVHGSSSEQRDSLIRQLELSNSLIEELRAADTLVLGAPMYNFGIPATLKQWIDAVCRAGVSFAYTGQGPVGLLGVKRAFIITSSGGTEIGSDSDYASRYLAHICRFIGIETIHVIDASGSKRTPQEIIERGKRQIDALLAGEGSVRAA